MNRITQLSLSIFTVLTLTVQLVKAQGNVTNVTPDSTELGTTVALQISGINTVFTQATVTLHKVGELPRPKKSYKIKTKQEFVAKYDKVFHPSCVNELSNHKYEDLGVFNGGISIHAGYGATYISILCDKSSKDRDEKTCMPYQIKIDMIDNDTGD